MKLIPLFVCAFVVFWACLRFWPEDNDHWHVDPLDKTQNRASEVRLIGEKAVRFDDDARDTLTKFDAILKAEPRTRPVNGSIAEGMITYVVRTRIMGYRDYVTIKAVDEGDGSTLSVFARPALPVYDWGVNQKRVDRWLGLLVGRS